MSRFRTVGAARDYLKQAGIKNYVRIVDSFRAAEALASWADQQAGSWYDEGYATGTEEGQAAEHEACAVIADDLAQGIRGYSDPLPYVYLQQARILEDLAAAIRARGEASDPNDGKKLGDLINQSKPGDVIIWGCSESGGDDEQTD